MSIRERAPMVRAGVAAAAPLAVGVFPFALVAGAAPVAAGFGLVEALGLSVIVFAGASQLALIDVFDDGGVWIVAAITALSINLRMLLYSASLARPLAHTSVARRLAAAYFLIDQAYALSIVRWDDDDDDGDDPDDRLPFYFAVGGFLWLTWVVGTVLGALVGAKVPDEIPLDFAVPLVFLVLLVPVLTTRPAVVAAAVGGIGAVVAAEAGADHLAVLLGGLAGIVAGAIVDARTNGDGPETLGDDSGAGEGLDR